MANQNYYLFQKLRSFGVKLASKMSKNDDRKFQNTHENLFMVADDFKIAPNAENI